MPWIIDEVEDKIQNAMGKDNLSSLYIKSLEGKSYVANEFLDLLCSYDFPEHGLDKLTFHYINNKCEPFEEDVMSRLANLCPRLTQLELSHMH